MSNGDWIALLGIAVTLLVFVVTWQWRAADARKADIREEKARNERLIAENNALRDANINLKIANAQFGSMATALDRTLSALPIQRTEGSAP